MNTIEAPDLGGSIGAAGTWIHDLMACLGAVGRGGKIMIAGNGGSAAEAQHFAAELVVRYQKDRPPIAALALTTDTSTITACANDYGYDQIFARQIRALGKPGDVFIGLTTSGKSANINEAFKEASRRGIVILEPPNPELMNTAQRQQLHLEWLHWLAGQIESRLYPDV